MKIFLRYNIKYKIVCSSLILIIVGPLMIIEMHEEFNIIESV
jgi:hypothetical protein